MLYINVCDDEPGQLNRIYNLVQDYVTDNQIECEIVKSSTCEDLIKDPTLFDIIFLDIEMGEGEINGIEAAKILREQNKRAIIIYVTGYKDFVMSAQETHYFYYLLKPFDAEAFNRQFKEAIEYKWSDDAKEAETIKLMTDKGPKKLRTIEIYYFEADRYNVNVHFRTNYYVVKSTLAEIIKMLNPKSFASPHKSYIVNLEHIEDVDKIENKIIFDNGKTLPLAVRRANDFERLYNDYLFED